MTLLKKALFLSFFVLLFLIIVPFKSFAASTLTVVRDGAGSGTVTSDPAGISCGNKCLKGYNDDANVTLTATPDAGSIFAGWSGDADCFDGNVTIIVAKICFGNQPGCLPVSGVSKTCIATFNLTVPDPPTSLTGSPFCAGSNNADVTLSWIDNSSDETGFKIYRGTVAGFIPDDAINLIGVVLADTTAWTDTSPGPSTTYYYRVRAYNAGGNSSTTSSPAITTSSCVFSPPTASFITTPPSGTISTTFNVDASGSSDPETPLADLRVRWDWENDGTWDTGWSTTKTNSHIYSTAGLKTIKMRVRDQDGLTDDTTRAVTVVNPSPPTADDQSVTTNQNTDKAVALSGIKNSDGVVDITHTSLNFHSLAVKSDGTVWGWGLNSWNQVGDCAGSSFCPVPNKINGLSGFDNIVKVAAGFESSIALKSDGTVWVWGRDGAVSSNPTAQQVIGLSNIVGITAGGDLGFLYALAQNGSIYEYQLRTNSLSLLPSLPGVVSILGSQTIAGKVLFAVKSDGAVWRRVVIGAWEPIPNLNNVVSIANGVNYGYSADEWGYLFALKENGTVEYSQKGVTTPIGGLTNVVAINGYGRPPGINAGYLLALESNGDVWEWKKGVGIPETLAKVVGLNNIVNVGGGDSYYLTLKSNSTVWAWGENEWGRLGDNTVTYRLTPIQSQFSLTYIVSSLPANGSLKDAANNLITSVPYSLGTNPNVTYTPNFNFVSPPNDSFQFKVNNGIQDSAAATVSITVNSVSTPPTASFTTTPPSGTVSTTFNVNASGSSDPETPLADLRVRWDWENDGTWDTGWSTTKTNSHIYSTAGVKTIKMEVKDTGGLTDDTTRAVTVTINPSPPTADDQSVITDQNTAKAVALNGVKGGDGVIKIESCGHSLSIRSNSDVWVWGYNGWGQLGDGTYNPSNIPIQVKGPGGVGNLTNIVRTACGPLSSLAVKFDGTVWAWGDNTRGQLGNGVAGGNQTTPVQVKGPGGVGNLTDVVTIAASGDSTATPFSLALKSDGTVWAWGDNTRGQLGNGVAGGNQTTPVQVKGPGGVGNLTDVVTIAAGFRYSLAVKSDGTVWAWGDNTFGMLGDNNAPNGSVVPVQVKGPGGVGNLTDVVDVAAGGSFSLALKSDGTVWAWGADVGGQLGNDMAFSPSAYTPVQVAGLGGVGNLTEIVKIDAFVGYSLALKSDGTVLAWGYNLNGSLGDNTEIDRYVPVQVKGPGGVGNLTDVVDVAAGGSRALKSDGTVWAWGYNGNGDLGDNKACGNDKCLTPVHTDFQLSYLVSSIPPNGSLKDAANNPIASVPYSLGTNPNVTYTPNLNFVSPPNDSFQFKVSNGIQDSAAATVTITVNQVGPSAPSNVSGVACSANSVGPTITWRDNSNNEDFFDIYRSKNAAFFPPVQVVFVTSAPTADKAGVGGMQSRTEVPRPAFNTYYYKVIARNAGGSSSPSGASNAVIINSNCEPTASNPSLIPSPASEYSTLTASFLAANAVSGTPVKGYRFLRGAVVLRAWGASNTYACAPADCPVGSTITFEGKATDGVTYSSIVSASVIIKDIIAVGLSAIPSQGNGAFNSTLTATVYNNVGSGDYTYTFNCGNGAPVIVKTTSLQTSSTAPSVCAYNGQGSYTARVDVTRTDADPGSATKIIAVKPPLPRFKERIPE